MWCACRGNGHLVGGLRPTPGQLEAVVRGEREGRVAVPAGPAPDLVLVEPRPRTGRGQHVPVALQQECDVHQFGQRGRRAGLAEVSTQVLAGTGVAAQQQPPRRAPRPTDRQPDPCPLVRVQCTCRSWLGHPEVGGEHRGQGRGRVPAPAVADHHGQPVTGGHTEDEPHAALLQEPAEFLVGHHGTGGDPARGHLRGNRPGNHRAGQFGDRAVRQLLGYTRRPAKSSVREP